MYMLQSAHVVSCTCCKVHMLLIAWVANCMCCNVPKKSVPDEIFCQIYPNMSSFTLFLGYVIYLYSFIYFNCVCLGGGSNSPEGGGCSCFCTSFNVQCVAPTLFSNKSVCDD